LTGNKCQGYSFIVKGEPASKSNSRRAVTIRGKMAFIKSKKAIDYVRAFQLQCPKINPLMEGDLEVEITIFYASRRPDLDESVILDCIQGFLYSNDRQVKSKIIRWGLSKSNPRAEIEVRPLKKPPRVEGA
jgi:Holliday junction resolvase RusA-like endonuclease